jgi:mannose-6-phosphate isomerase-like protein (cupin superfamily)
MSNVSSPKNIAAALVGLWSPRVIGEVNDTYIKVTKLHDSPAWHIHEEKDELFFLLRGHLRIELEGSSVELGEGEMSIVPKGVRHDPVGEEQCEIMLIERKSTLHTGALVTAGSWSFADQLQSI